MIYLCIELSNPYSMLNILIADDHPMFRVGLLRVLKYLDESYIVHQVSNGVEVLDFLKDNPCDLIIMDINMPIMNGIKTTEIVRAEFPKVKVVGVSMFDDSFHVSRMVDAGANGYSTKEINIDELQLMLSTVLEGGFYISKEVSHWLSKDFKRTNKHFDNKLREELSEREVEILVLLCGQLSSKEIADKLKISYRTVQTHRLKITEKTGAMNAVGLVLYAIEKGYILVTK